MTGSHSQEYGSGTKSRDIEFAKTHTHDNKNESVGTDYNYKHEVLWDLATGFLILHILAGYGFVLLFTGTYKFYTVLWTLFLLMLSIEGVAISAHRYYSHRTFKAKPLLRAFLLIMQTFTGQLSMYTWCRVHRMHHRYSDTDGDPHNSQRGFFFSHIGWLITKKHPLIDKFRNQINMSDLEADWMVMFQKKYYLRLFLVIGVIIPAAVPVFYFGESWTNSVFLSVFLRYVCSLHNSLLFNSMAHIYGSRPYDGNIQPTESLFLSLITLGEGCHNYHHTFPWDYNSAELTEYINLSAKLIRFFEFIGLAWDLKTASPEMVKKRVIRTGDGTHYLFGNDEARAAVTAVGFVHPLNPTYTTIRNNTKAGLNHEGLPLYRENDVNNKLHD